MALNKKDEEKKGKTGWDLLEKIFSKQILRVIAIIAFVFFILTASMILYFGTRGRSFKGYGFELGEDPYLESNILATCSARENPCVHVTQTIEPRPIPQGSIGQLNSTDRIWTGSIQYPTQKYLLDTPVNISFEQKNFLKISPDFILWDKATIMIWVYVTPANEGVRNAPNNKYIFSHTTNINSPRGFPNHFVLRYSEPANSNRKIWEFLFSDNNPDYEESLVIPDDLEIGWHHFVIRWDHTNLIYEFQIDGNKYGDSAYKNEKFSQNWPDDVSDSVVIGSWPGLWEGHYCETKLYNLTIVNEFLSSTDDVFLEHIF